MGTKLLAFTSVAATGVAGGFIERGGKGGGRRKSRGSREWEKCAGVRVGGGEEERGGMTLVRYLLQHRHIVAATVVRIADGVCGAASATAGHSGAAKGQQPWHFKPQLHH